MVKPMIKVIYCNYGFKNPRKMFVCLFFLLNYYRDKCCCCLKDGKYTERINSRITENTSMPHSKITKGEKWSMFLRSLALKQIDIC